MAPHAPLLSPEQLVHLDRMAAAIAEVVQKGQKSVFTIDFGAQSGIAKSAVIGMDAHGALSITLVTPSSAIQPNGWAALRTQLFNRLDRRKIAVASIDLDLDPNQMILGKSAT
jgi:hypothetical protein